MQSSKTVRDHLLLSCKSGDLNSIKHLVELKDADLNFRDQWDTTPLYYACLCGHTEVVDFLLNNGARCEADTFDGERCFYAALTNEIKKMLSNSKMITSRTMRRNLYDEFLRRLLDGGSHSDMTLRLFDRKLPVHRCVLAVRCPHLHRKLKSYFYNGKSVKIKDQSLSPESLYPTLQFVYTGHLKAPLSLSPAIKNLAQNFGLMPLVRRIEKQELEIASFRCHQVMPKVVTKWKKLCSVLGRPHINDGLTKNTDAVNSGRDKPGLSLKVLTVESEREIANVKQDFRRLALQATPAHLHTLQPQVEEFEFESDNSLLLDQHYFPDVCFRVSEHRFTGHKAFFCMRSDFFKTLLTKHIEAHEDGLDVVTIHAMSPEIFTYIVFYIYTDSCQLTEETVYEILYTSDMLLLPGLTRLSAAFIGQRLDSSTVFTAVDSARLLKLDKLENQCMEFIAWHLDELIDETRLSDLILADANSVVAREESDTIDVVDSIRHHLTANCSDNRTNRSNCTDHKLELLNGLLLRLNLDC